MSKQRVNDRIYTCSLPWPPSIKNWIFMMNDCRANWHHNPHTKSIWIFNYCQHQRFRCTETQNKKKLIWTSSLESCLISTHINYASYAQSQISSTWKRYDVPLTITFNYRLKSTNKNQNSLFRCGNVSCISVVHWLLISRILQIVENTWEKGRKTWSSIHLSHIVNLETGQRTPNAYINILVLTVWMADWLNYKWLDENNKIPY